MWGGSFWSIGWWDCLIFILSFPSGLGVFACCLDWDQIPSAWNSSFLCALQMFLVLLATSEHAVNVLLNQIPLKTSSGPEKVPHCLVLLGTSVPMATASQTLQQIIWCASSFIILILKISIIYFSVLFSLCSVTSLPLSGSPYKEEQERDLKAALKGTDPSIPLVFVSGNHDLGNTPTPSSVEQYCNSWGDDYFSFWVNHRSNAYISSRWMVFVGLDAKFMALWDLRVYLCMLNLFSSLQFASHTVVEAFNRIFYWSKPLNLSSVRFSINSMLPDKVN